MRDDDDDDCGACGKAKYEVRSKEELKKIIQQHLYGIPLRDLKDSYTGVEVDAKALEEEHQIISIKNQDAGTQVLFYSYPQYYLNIDGSFVDMWNKVELPDEMDLEKKLFNAGLKNEKELAQGAARRTKRVAQQPTHERPKKKAKRLRLTNTHVPDIDLTQDYKPPEG